MGCGMLYLEYLSDRGVFLQGKARVLDIGAQNLLGANEGALRNFIQKYSPDKSGRDLETTCLDLSARSELKSGVNATLLGELFVQTPIEYVSLDIFSSVNTIIFDLNTSTLPILYRDSFDVVLNFGTTEHVLNQMNCFKIIHEAVKVGGYIFHQVPGVGYVDHGYFTYSPKLFRELAIANGYELLDLWFSGPQNYAKLLDQIGYCTETLRDPRKIHNNVIAWDVREIPNSVVNVLLKKQGRGEFRMPLDVSTAIAPMDAAIRTMYKVAGSAPNVALPSMDEADSIRTFADPEAAIPRIRTKVLASALAKRIRTKVRQKIGL